MNGQRSVGCEERENAVEPKPFVTRGDDISGEGGRISLAAQRGIFLGA